MHIIDYKLYPIILVISLFKELNDYKNKSFILLNI